MGVYGDVVVSDGLCVSCTVSKKGGCQIHSAVTYMMAGLLVLNVYAEYFSLFAGVGFWASLIAVFAAVIGGMLLRRDLADFSKFRKYRHVRKNGKKRRRD